MRPSHQRGFTLIELMIAVAIIGVIASIAFPSYNSYIQKTRRSAAAACLSEHAQFMERYRTSNMSYSGATLATLACSTDLSTAYTFAFKAGEPTASTFEIEATPRSTGPMASDTACATLSTTHTSAKKISGTGTVADCWR